jgi:hypothetical protein
MQPGMMYPDPNEFDPFATPNFFEPEGRNDLHPTFPGMTRPNRNPFGGGFDPN